MPTALLGLGSNIGDKEGYIDKALGLISELYEVKKVSPLYLTEPVGNIKQEWFLNCVVEIKTDFNPKKLLSSFKSIERKLGRIKRVKNGPRCIDIDILFYGDQIIKTKNLIIPHQLVQDRLFVLKPLMDIAPHFIHPVLKKSIEELYKNHQWTEKVILYK